jgi:hypothetical protein
MLDARMFCLVGKADHRYAFFHQTGYSAPRPPTVTHSLHTFAGGNALSSFKTRQLLPQLQAISDRITGLSGHFVHLAAFDGHPDAATLARVAELMTYGEPALAQANGPATVTVVVSPRLGTVSPWASKATDIAHNCGLVVRRLERVTEFQLTLKTQLLGKASLTDAQLTAVAALLHDRMTESVFASSEARRWRCSPNWPRRPWRTWTCWPVAARLWSKPTSNSAWPWPTMKWITSSPASLRWAATPPTWS